MKNIISKVLVLALALSVSACGGNSGGNQGGTNTPANGKAVNSYTNTEVIFEGEHNDPERATLVLYSDGSGTLDFADGWHEAEDVVLDPAGMVLYTVTEAFPYPVEVEGDRVSVYYSSDIIYVFEPKEKGFDIANVTNDALTALVKKLETENPELAAAFAAVSQHSSEEGWIHIRTPEEFLHIADDLSGKYVLDADINDWNNGQSTVFSPIGTPDNPFTGELDGNGHIISGMLAYTGQEEAAGLFGCSDGYIHDLVIGYMSSEEMSFRELDAWEREIRYDSLNDAGLAADSTQYYGILCGLNRGTLKNISFKDRAGVPDMNLYPNTNDKIYIGLIAGYNAGTISGVHLFSTGLTYRTFDKDTAVDIGVLTGYQTADAVMEDVSLESSSITLDSFGEYILNIAPVVKAGVLIGEAEGSPTIRGTISLKDCRTYADYSLADADLRIGGLIGVVQGDIALSNIELEEVNARFDARTDQDGYSPSLSTPAASAVVVGWAEGNVSVSDIHLTNCAAKASRREGGNPLPSYVGGIVGYCGGEITAANINVEGRLTNVDASVEQGVAYAGGLCGYSAQTADVRDCQFSFSMSPWFSGSTLYAASVLGYVAGDAVFNNVQADCGIDEDTGQPKNHSVMAVNGRTYYLAALAGGAGASVTAENCVINMQWNVIGGGATIHGAENTDGLYNPA